MTRNGNGPAGPEGTTMTDACDTIVSRSRLIERGGTTRAALMGGVSVMAMVIGGLPQVAKAQTVLSGSSYSLPTQTGTGSSTFSITSSGTITPGNANGLPLTGQWASITNSGLINGNGYYTGIISSGALTIGTIFNGGRIVNSEWGVALNGSAATSIGSIINSGTITARYYGLNSNYGSNNVIRSINNSGIITGGATGFNNNGLVGTLTNSGTIAMDNSVNGWQVGIMNYAGGSGAASIGTINNATSGHIYGQYNAIVNYNGSSPAIISSITNFGDIHASYWGIRNLWGTIGTITNNFGGSITTYLLGGSFPYAGNTQDYSQAAVTNYGGTITSIINNGYISGPSRAVHNEGVLGSLTNSGLMTSPGVGFLNYTSWSTGTVTNNSGGTIYGGREGIYNTYKINTIKNAGLIQGGNIGIGNADYNSSIRGTILSISNSANSGTITGGVTGIYNTGYITSITNTGKIYGSGGYGIMNTQNSGYGTISGINNSGTIQGSRTGIYNYNFIYGTITNSGQILGTTGPAITNYNKARQWAEISAIENSGTISGLYGYQGNGLLPVFNNQGLVEGKAQSAIQIGGVGGNSNGTGWIGSLTNSGSIISAAGYSGIEVTHYNGYRGTLSNLTNKAGGYIYGGAYGIQNNNSDIYTILNDGIIDSARTGIFNPNGQIWAITNTGTISGTVNAINSDGYFGSSNSYGGTIYNSGLISGNVTISGNVQMIGGTGGVFGSLTNGHLSVTGNLGLSGNLFLGDNINVNGTVGTLTNNGYLRVSAPLTIGGTLLGGSISTLRFDIANSNGSNITYSSAGVPSGLTIGAQGKLSATRVGTIQGTISIVQDGPGMMINGEVVTILSSPNTLSVPTAGATATISTPYAPLAFNANLSTINGNTIVATLVNGAAAAVNTGSYARLTNNGTLSGGRYGIYNSGSITSIENTSLVNGGENGFFNFQGTIEGISNYGTIQGQWGLKNGEAGNGSGRIGQLTNSGFIGSVNNIDWGLVNYSTITTLTNSGTISGVSGLAMRGSITELNNSGRITGEKITGIDNSGWIGNLSNSGTISGQQYSLYNTGMITSLTNYAIGTFTGGNGTFGIYNSGTMGLVTNAGLIIAAQTGFYNSGKISGLSNTGTITSLNNAGGAITGGTSGIVNSRQLTTLTNTGVISGTKYGVRNTGTSAKIESLDNSAGGLITGAAGTGGSTTATATGVFNSGSIGTLTNSGVISGDKNAIKSTYTLRYIKNRGEINGNITIKPATSTSGDYITITGADSGALGTLKGGTISTEDSNLIFYQNNLLQDDVVFKLTSGKLVNNANAQLSLYTNQTITGNFKNSGTLLLGDGKMLTSVTFDNSGTVLSLSGDGAMLTVTEEWLDPPASSTGEVHLQASRGDASAVGTRVIAQTGVALDASLATIDGIGYGVSNIRNISGPAGTHLLVADVVRTDFVFRQEGNLVVTSLGGTRAVIQKGPGSTYLLGPQTYTGPTFVTGGVLGLVGSSVSPRYLVNGGTLRIDGVATGSVTVRDGGMLAGSGVFGGGTIGAGGIVAPSNIAALAALSAARDAIAANDALSARAPTAPGVAVRLTNPAGNLVSNGNLTLSAGSTYRVGVNAQGLSDHLLVNGTATLGGGAVDVRALPGAYGYRTSYTILQAADGVVGTFGAVATELPFLTPTLTYDPAQVMLTLRRNDVPYHQVAATQNQFAVASGLEGSFRTSLSPAGAGVIDVLTFSAAPKAQAMLTQMSGEGIVGAQTASYAAVSQFATAVRGQGMDWVMGPMGNPGEAGSPQEPGPQWRSWAAAMGSNGHIDGVGSVGSATVSARGGGGLAGLEVRINENFGVGIAAGGVTSSYTVSERATSGKQTGGIGAVYGVARFDRLYAMGLVSYGGFGTKSTRYVAGPVGVETATGSFSSNAWTGRMELGYRFENPLANVSPYVAIQGTSLGNSGFTETTTTAAGAAGAMGLAVQGRGGSSVPGALGVQLDRRFSIDDDWAIRPVLRLAWVHEFSGTRAVTAGLAAIPASAWTVQGASAATDAADINLSVQVLHRNGLALTASAAAYAAPRATGMQGQLRVSYQW